MVVVPTSIHLPFCISNYSINCCRNTARNNGDTICQNYRRSTSSNFGKMELGKIAKLGFDALPRRNLVPQFRKIGQKISCKAAETSSSSSSSSDVYQGVYGPWTIDSSDVREVFLYFSLFCNRQSYFVQYSFILWLKTVSLLKLPLYFIVPVSRILYFLVCISVRIIGDLCYQVIKTSKHD